MSAEVVVGLVVIAAWWFWVRTKHQASSHLAAMWALRFPTFDTKRLDEVHVEVTTFFDFEAMVFVEQREFLGNVAVRVYDLRRLDGPTWEIRERSDSWERLTVKDEATPAWKAAFRQTAAQVEVWYQRFIAQYRPTVWPVTRVEASLKALAENRPAIRPETHKGTDGPIGLGVRWGATREEVLERHPGAEAQEGGYLGLYRELEGVRFTVLVYFLDGRLCHVFSVVPTDDMRAFMGAFSKLMINRFGFAATHRAYAERDDPTWADNESIVSVHFADNGQLCVKEYPAVEYLKILSAAPWLTP
jgi:hypothetical protein